MKKFLAPQSLKSIFASTLCVLMIAESVPASPLAPSFSLALSLPSAMGFVSDVFAPAGKNLQTPDVIVIQDLHVNRSVQFAISRILGHLNKDHWLPERIGVEGASGPVEVQSMQSYPSAHARTSAADYLLRQGEMAGDMHFVVSEGKGGLYGLETPNVYSSIVDLYRKSYESRTGLKVELDRLRQAIAQLSKNGDSQVRTNAAVLQADVDSLSELVDQRISGTQIKGALRKAVLALDHMQMILPADKARDLLTPVSSAINFYMLALMRDKELFQNFLQLRQTDHQATSVLVIGGFHTPGMTEQLKKAGLSYIVITPNVRRHTKTDEKLYVERMLGHHLTADQVASGIDWASQLVRQPIAPDLQSGLFPAAIGRRSRVLSALVLYLASYASGLFAAPQSGIVPGGPSERDMATSLRAEADDAYIPNSPWQMVRKSPKTSIPAVLAVIAHASQDSKEFARGLSDVQSFIEDQRFSNNDLITQVVNAVKIPSLVDALAQAAGSQNSQIAKAAARILPYIKIDRADLKTSIPKILALLTHLTTDDQTQQRELLQEAIEQWIAGLPKWLPSGSENYPVFETSPDPALLPMLLNDILLNTQIPEDQRLEAIPFLEKFGDMRSLLGNQALAQLLIKGVETDRLEIAIPSAQVLGQMLVKEALGPIRKFWHAHEWSPAPGAFGDGYYILPNALDAIESAHEKADDRYRMHYVWNYHAASTGDLLRVASESVGMVAPVNEPGWAVDVLAYRPHDPEAVAGAIENLRSPAGFYSHETRYEHAIPTLVNLYRWGAKDPNIISALLISARDGETKDERNMARQGLKTLGEDAAVLTLGSLEGAYEHRESADTISSLRDVLHDIFPARLDAWSGSQRGKDLQMVYDAASRRQEARWHQLYAILIGLWDLLMPLFFRRKSAAVKGLVIFVSSAAAAGAIAWILGTVTPMAIIGTFTLLGAASLLASMSRFGTVTMTLLAMAIGFSVGGRAQTPPMERGLAGSPQRASSTLIAQTIGGFSSQETAQINTFLGLLPEAHKLAYRDISKVAIASSEARQDSYAEVDAKTRKIVLHVNPKQGLNLISLANAMGKIVYSQVLTAAERREWDGLYRTSSQGPAIYNFLDETGFNPYIPAPNLINPELSSSKPSGAASAEDDFASFYANWINNLGGYLVRKPELLVEAARRAEYGNPLVLQKSLYLAGVFLDPKTGYIPLYKVLGDHLEVTAQQAFPTKTTFQVGRLVFTFKNNQITGIQDKQLSQGVSLKAVPGQSIPIPANLRKGLNTVAAGSPRLQIQYADARPGFSVQINQQPAQHDIAVPGFTQEESKQIHNYLALLPVAHRNAITKITKANIPLGESSLGRADASPEQARAGEITFYTNPGPGRGLFLEALGPAIGKVIYYSGVLSNAERAQWESLHKQSLAGGPAVYNFLDETTPPTFVPTPDKLRDDARLSGYKPTSMDSALADFASFYGNWLNDQVRIPHTKKSDLLGAAAQYLGYGFTSVMEKSLFVAGLFVNPLTNTITLYQIDDQGTHALPTPLKTAPQSFKIGDYTFDVARGRIVGVVYYEAQRVPMAQINGIAIPGRLANALSPVKQAVPKANAKETNADRKARLLNLLPGPTTLTDPNDQANRLQGDNGRAVAYALETGRLNDNLNSILAIVNGPGGKTAVASVLLDGRVPKSLKTRLIEIVRADKEARAKAAARAKDPVAKQVSGLLDTVQSHDPLVSEDKRDDARLELNSLLVQGKIVYEDQQHAILLALLNDSIETRDGKTLVSGALSSFYFLMNFAQNADAVARRDLATLVFGQLQSVEASLSTSPLPGPNGANAAEWNLDVLRWRRLQLLMRTVDRVTAERHENEQSVLDLNAKVLKVQSGGNKGFIYLVLAFIGLALAQTLRIPRWLLRRLRGAMGAGGDRSGHSAEGAPRELDLFGERYLALQRENARLPSIREEDLTRSRRFLAPDGSLLARDQRKNTEGVSQAFFIPEGPVRHEMNQMALRLRGRFGSKLYPINADKLHLTTQLDASAHPFRVKFGRLQWNKDMGIFWPITIVGHEDDPRLDQLRAWGLSGARPPHVTVAYFAQALSAEELQDLERILAGQPLPGEVDVDHTEVVHYSDLAFNDNDGFSRDSVIPFQGTPKVLPAEDAFQATARAAALDVNAIILGLDAAKVADLSKKNAKANYAVTLVAGHPLEGSVGPAIRAWSSELEAITGGKVKLNGNYSHATVGALLRSKDQPVTEADLSNVNFDTILAAVEKAQAFSLKFTKVLLSPGQEGNIVLAGEVASTELNRLQRALKEAGADLKWTLQEEGKPARVFVTLGHVNSDILASLTEGEAHGFKGWLDSHSTLPEPLTVNVEDVHVVNYASRMLDNMVRPDIVLPLGQKSSFENGEALKKEILTPEDQSGGPGTRGGEVHPVTRPANGFAPLAMFFISLISSIAIVVGREILAFKHGADTWFHLTAKVADAIAVAQKPDLASVFTPMFVATLLTASLMILALKRIRDDQQQRLQTTSLANSLLPEVRKPGILSTVPHFFPDLLTNAWVFVTDPFVRKRLDHEATPYLSSIIDTSA